MKLLTTCRVLTGPTARDVLKLHVGASLSISAQQVDVLGTVPRLACLQSYLGARPRRDNLLCEGELKVGLGMKDRTFGRKASHDFRKLHGIYDQGHM